MWLQVSRTRLKGSRAERLDLLDGVRAGQLERKNIALLEGDLAHSRLFCEGRRGPGTLGQFIGKVFEHMLYELYVIAC